MTGRVPWVLSVAALITVLTTPETRWLCSHRQGPTRPGRGKRLRCVGGLKLVLPWLPGAHPWGGLLE